MASCSIHLSLPRATVPEVTVIYTQKKALPEKESLLGRWNEPTRQCIVKEGLVAKRSDQASDNGCSDNGTCYSGTEVGQMVVMEVVYGMSKVVVGLVVGIVPVPVVSAQVTPTSLVVANASLPSRDVAVAVQTVVATSGIDHAMVGVMLHVHAGSALGMHHHLVAGTSHTYV